MIFVSSGYLLLVAVFAFSGIGKLRRLSVFSGQIADYQLIPGSLIPLAAVGIAGSSVICQSYTLVAFAIVLARNGLNPFSSTAKIASALPASERKADNQEMELLLHERLSDAEPHTY